jgi:hypothetical protein
MAEREAWVEKHTFRGATIHRWPCQGVGKTIRHPRQRKPCTPRDHQQQDGRANNAVALEDTRTSFLRRRSAGVPASRIGPSPTRISGGRGPANLSTTTLPTPPQPLLYFHGDGSSSTKDSHAQEGSPNPVHTGRGESISGTRACHAGRPSSLWSKSKLTAAPRASELQQFP